MQVTDARGFSRSASLFFVSPHQVNYQMPSETAEGPATVVVSSGNGVVSRSSVQVASVAPGLFSANSEGTGVAAAFAVRVDPAGSQEVLPVFQCGGEPRTCTAVPVDLGTEGDQVFLILYGTGVRAAETVSVLVGGLPADVHYAGAQGEYVGLDQINALLPHTLRGRGLVEVSLDADGKMANPVTMQVR